ncbi:MAG: hypothetical protein M0C28_40605 [Candidatus Moduliflexus flocculans]|nr:hypothetical protein [Candidatus Moduliflexus flocculans]
MGGIEVHVPRDWEVVLEGTPVLGSIESHKIARPRDREDGHPDRQGLGRVRLDRGQGLGAQMKKGLFWITGRRHHPRPRPSISG